MQGTTAVDVTLPVTVIAGQLITATATDPDGNTSEFSNCVQISGPTPSYAAIGTGPFTRIAPADKSIYTGNLGTYNVSWTHGSGNPAFVAVKFEPVLKNFNNGTAEVFSVVVSNFNPNTTIQVEADAGSRSGTFNFVLGQTNCAFATLSPQPPEDSFDWRYRLWNNLVIWNIANWMTLYQWGLRS